MTRKRYTKIDTIRNLSTEYYSILINHITYLKQSFLLGSFIGYMHSPVESSNLSIYSQFVHGAAIFYVHQHHITYSAIQRTLLTENDI